MKKFFALVLTVAMVASLGIMAFAEKGGFVYSPSVNPAPIVEDHEHPDEDCPAELVVTPYSRRGPMGDEDEQNMEEAYKDILDVKEGEALYDILNELAEELGVPVEMLLVSDLFNLDYTDCDDPDKHVPYSVKLSSDTFKNFAGLVHYKDGKWVAVDDVTVDENGIMTFSYEGFGAFAVVVDTSESGSPITGDNGILIFCIVMMAVSAVGFVTVFTVAKKKKNAQVK